MPEELLERARELEMPVMALCDRDGFYGSPRFFKCGKELGIRPIIGVELTMEGGVVLPVLVESRQGYQNMCRLITTAQLRGAKGESRVQWAELAEHKQGIVAL